MSVAKVIELISEGDSIEEACENAVKQAKKSVRNIRSVYIENITAGVRDDEIKHYRVNAKVTFVVD